MNLYGHLMAPLANRATKTTTFYVWLMPATKTQIEMDIFSPEIFHSFLSFSLSSSASNFFLFKTKKKKFLKVQAQLRPMHKYNWFKFAHCLSFLVTCQRRRRPLQASMCCMKPQQVNMAATVNHDWNDIPVSGAT